LPVYPVPKLMLTFGSKNSLAFGPFKKSSEWYFTSSLALRLEANAKTATNETNLFIFYPF
jgi:hypothetical protein